MYVLCYVALNTTIESPEERMFEILTSTIFNTFIFGLSSQMYGCLTNLWLYKGK
jgi:hypothetical protein